MIQIWQQEMEEADLESSEEGAASRPLLCQTYLFALRVDPNPYLIPHSERIVFSEVMQISLRDMLRMNIDTIALGQEVRGMEHIIVSMGLTPLTHLLSFHI